MIYGEQITGRRVFLAAVTTGYDSLIDADGLLWFESLYMHYQLEY